MSTEAYLPLVLGLRGQTEQCVCFRALMPPPFKYTDCYRSFSFFSFFFLSLLTVPFIVMNVCYSNFSGFWSQSIDNNSNLLKYYIVLFFERQLISKICQFGSYFWPFWDFFSTLCVAFIPAHHTGQHQRSKLFSTWSAHSFQPLIKKSFTKTNLAHI